MSKWQRLAVMLALNTMIAASAGVVAAWWIVRRAVVVAQPSVTAQRFVLRDESGHIGAEMRWENSEPGLRLFDQANQVRLALFLEPNGVPDLYLYDSNKLVRAALNLFDSGVPNLAFVDAAGKSMVRTDYDRDHSYNVTFVAIGPGASHVLGSRRLTVDPSGVHESAAPEPSASH